MKNFLTLLVVLILNDLYFAQSSLVKIDSLQNPVALQLSSKVETINLSGSSKELVITIGYPDRNPTYSKLTNNDPAYPVLGIKRDGTLISTYIAQNGGAVNIDQFYEAALEDYFHVHSTTTWGVMDNVDFVFVKYSMRQLKSGVLLIQ